MRNLVKYCVVVALLLFVPALAQADSQCTTTELDLMCPNGQILQGIKSDGTKLCVDKPAEFPTDLLCPEGEVLQGIKENKTKACVEASVGDKGSFVIASIDWSTRQKKDHSDICIIVNEETGACSCSDGFSPAIKGDFGDGKVDRGCPYSDQRLVNMSPIYGTSWRANCAIELYICEKV